MTSPVGYWQVDDIKACLEALLDAGAEAQQPISDVGGGKPTATVTDADGKPIGLLQAPRGRRGPRGLRTAAAGGARGASEAERDVSPRRPKGAPRGLPGPVLQG